MKLTGYQGYVLISKTNIYILFKSFIFSRKTYFKGSEPILLLVAFLPSRKNNGLLSKLEKLFLRYVFVYVDVQIELKLIINLQNDGPCTRCQMVCIDQSTGEKTVEPLRTIAAAGQGKMQFGVYFSQINLNQNNIILVGSPIKPLDDLRGDIIC
jgi:hypothetical protein